VQCHHLCLHDQSCAGQRPTGYSAIIYAWTSKSSPGFKRPNTHSAHGPTLEYDSSETSQAAEQSPPRSRVLAEAPGRASHLHLARGSEAALGEQENSTLGRALRGASVRGGNSASLEAPSVDWGCNPPTQRTGTFIANHSTAWRGCSTLSAATSHSKHYRCPVRQLRSLCHHFRRCVGSPCPART